MLLYIEDNHAIAKNIVMYLEAEHFRVKWIDDGKKWLEEALIWHYDCVILDVMLPGMDGFAVCRELRKRKKIPIIMTTAKWEIEDKGTAFSDGADDYLVKPFDAAELVMRIHALLERAQVSDIVHLENIDIYIDENRCVKDGHDVHLTLKERQILLELIDANGITVSRADIVESIRWSDALFEAEWKLDVYIANLRKKLSSTCIETVRWVWYKIRT